MRDIASALADVYVVSEQENMDAISSPMSHMISMLLYIVVNSIKYILLQRCISFMQCLEKYCQPFYNSSNWLACKMSFFFSSIHVCCLLTVSIRLKIWIQNNNLMRERVEMNVTRNSIIKCSQWATHRLLHHSDSSSSASQWIH